MLYVPMIFFYIPSIYFKYNTMFFYFISLKMCERESHRNTDCRFALFLLSLLSFWFLPQYKFTCFVFFLCHQAFSAFFFIHSFLQQVTGITVNTPSQLEEATKTVCTMTYSQVVIFCYGFVQCIVNHLCCAIYCISMRLRHPILHHFIGQSALFLFELLECWFLLQLLAVAPDEKSRLQDYCASSVFVKTLMLGGYRFNDKTFPHILFQRKVGTLSLLYQTLIILYWYCSMIIYFLLIVIMCFWLIRQVTPQWVGLWDICSLWATCCLQRQQR